MATYIALSADRETVSLMLSKAEADALRKLASHAYEACEVPMNHMTMAAADRALNALSAATNNNARRAGYFE